MVGPVQVPVGESVERERLSLSRGRGCVCGWYEVLYLFTFWGAMLPSSSRHGAAEVQGDSLHRWLPWASRNRTHRARQSTEPSTFSVLSVLTDEERAQGIGARNVSFHRVATVREGMPAQAVPRHIVQTGSSWPHALRHHHKWMRSWLDLNPEYEYSFFGDEHARRFVEKHGERREVAAYRRILTGSQRADLFRVIFLKVAGGIYADLDEELRRPMSELFGGTDESGEKIPHRATAVIGAFWPFEFLVFAPLHPILVETAKIMSDNILLQVGLQRNGSKGACKTPHECVIRVTGPLAFTSGVGMATVGHCRNRIRTPRQGECKFASDASLRNMHICQRDK
jgi:hypothetical protein